MSGARLGSASDLTARASWAEGEQQPPHALALTAAARTACAVRRQQNTHKVAAAVCLSARLHAGHRMTVSQTGRKSGGRGSLKVIEEWLRFSFFYFRK